MLKSLISKVKWYLKDGITFLKFFLSLSDKPQTEPLGTCEGAEVRILMI